MRSIELLSPAKNLECGLAAINHGADAVYIGAEKFGARQAAANTVQDIAALVQYAHTFNARVYAALNTILEDKELEPARQLIWQLYEVGVDALIIQDMGILQLDLPPIDLHASTQTDNRTAEKVLFLEKAGFSQVVLARELSLEQIKAISAQTSVALEVFVHGALCVSYSGQCYISEALAGRSANRGACAQYCRLPYNLVDASGSVLLEKKHILSLKDLDLSEHLANLLEAGVRSFKIEGRLKEVSYVKNTTAYYRKKLDAILSGSTQFKQASSGKTSFYFNPDPQKTFFRGATDYFINERKPDICSYDTPKSVGAYIGSVSAVDSSFLELDTNQLLHNGDGLCFLDKEGGFSGFRVNRVEGNRVYPLSMPKIVRGVHLYRNFDIDFDKQLAKTSSERKIALTIRFSETPDGFLLDLSDEDNNQVSFPCVAQKEIALKGDKAMDTIRLQLSKLGNTIFAVEAIHLDLSEPYFIPSSHLGEWRRLAIEVLENLRSNKYQANLDNRVKVLPSYHPYVDNKLSYLGNVHNALAEAFYKQHGVTDIDPSFEKNQPSDVPLMFIRHCVKYSLGACAKYPGGAKILTNIPNEPYYLLRDGVRLSVSFDCAQCVKFIKKC